MSEVIHVVITHHYSTWDLVVMFGCAVGIPCVLGAATWAALRLSDRRH